MKVESKKDDKNKNKKYLHCKHRTLTRAQSRNTVHFCNNTVLFCIHLLVRRRQRRNLKKHESDVYLYVPACSSLFHFLFFTLCVATSLGVATLLLHLTACCSSHLYDISTVTLSRFSSLLFLTRRYDFACLIPPPTDRIKPHTTI